jgi:hypothetical protein
MTKQVEIYSSTLRLQASFTGLRYWLFSTLSTGNVLNVSTAIVLIGNYTRSFDEKLHSCVREVEVHYGACVEKH